MLTNEDLQAIQEMVEASVLKSENRIMNLIKGEIRTSERRVISEFEKKLAPVHAKLDNLQFQMDTVYNWVDGIDIEVKELKEIR